MLPDIPRRSDVIRSHKAQGGRVAAVLPIHYPRALLRALGFLPVEVWGPPALDYARGAAHLQPYVCSLVRNALSFLLSGGLDIADLIVIPHGCDSLQGLASLLIDFVQPRQLVLPVYLPRSPTAAGVAFLGEELRELGTRLASCAGHPLDTRELWQAIHREERAEGVLQRLHTERLRLSLSNLAHYRLVRSREYLPAEIFTDLGEAALANKSQEPIGGIRFVLSGVLPEPMALLSALDTMGVVVADDDLIACGRRLYPPGQSEDPFQHMAESLLAAPPDSTRGSSIDSRLEHLLGLTRRVEAKGVVFSLVKFCEPELFQLPSLRQGLKEAGIPSVVLEGDLNDPFSLQAQTRLEALVEMIQ
ncbi:MAG: 2-hydroxyacyl-CoA dehydratase family protein [Anaerolineales bacterium]|jgi:benzoyl-CoA reductase/2-hydroxyglutaryl-CoA dehydratase subunit BcrC/BadD/HgdB